MTREEAGAVLLEILGRTRVPELERVFVPIDEIEFADEQLDIQPAMEVKSEEAACAR